MKKEVWIGLPSLASTAHEAVRCICHARDGSDFFLIDATAGNGYDTLFLTKLATNPGYVIAFDIQPEALVQTRMRLEDAGYSSTSDAFPHLILAGHETMSAYTETLSPYAYMPVAAIMFNLGFLPGSDKSIRTRTDTTLIALEVAMQLLAPHGILTVHLYTGHSGGQEEAYAVLALANQLPRDHWRVLIFSEHNKTRNQEHLLLIEKGDIPSPNQKL